MKKLIAVAVCSAALCASTVFAEIIVPENPVNLVTGRSFATDQKFQSSVAPSDTASKLFDGDPLFADAENGDYTLEYRSPCVNAGSNSSVGSGETDLVGNPRIHRFGGRAKYDVVDMGCYESPWRHMNGLQILVR